MKTNSKGYITLVLIFFVLLLAFFIFPRKFVSPSLVNCPEKPTFSETLNSEITMPSIREIPDNVGGFDLDIPPKQFRMVRKDVKVNKYIRGDVAQGEFFESSTHTVPYQTKVINGKTYMVYYPGKFGEIDVAPGLNDPIIEDANNKNEIIVRARRMLYFVLADENGVPQTFNDKDQNGIDYPYVLVNFYQVTEGSIGPLKDGALCSNLTPQVTVPQQSTSPDNQQLQLEWFLFQSDYIISAHCKPAIYLYPKEKTLVNVKVKPLGPFTYTDPKYDAGKGWTVWANPDGTLINHQSSIINQTYPYLYYEAKIPDSEIKKPAKGWVMKYEELDSLYKDILPKLGLNEVQANDFRDYWNKHLPSSPYYFVGVIDQSNLDHIEPLEITPKPDYIKRVGIYFERLENPIKVEQPDLGTWNLDLDVSTFKVVEWGGLIKNDPNHPFTCSQ